MTPAADAALTDGATITIVTLPTVTVTVGTDPATSIGDRGGNGGRRA